jgi:hypothetical protein
VRSGLSQTVSDLVMSAMARNPDDRPQTMETFEYELNKALAGRGVAVAQILGMTTDPNVVDKLNAGIAIRNIDDTNALITPRAATSAPIAMVPRASTHSGGTEMPSMQSGPATVSTSAPSLPRASSEPRASSSGQMAAAALSGAQGQRQPSMSDYSSQPVIIRRSAAGAIGWLLLGAVLFGGVGALIYVAMGERGQRSQKTESLPAAQASDVMQPQSPAPTPSPSQSPAPNSATPDAATVERSPVPSPSTEPAGSGSDKTTLKGSAATPNKKQTGRPPPKKVAAADEKDPKALIAAGKAQEKAGDYDQARATYQKLGKIKGYAGKSLYMQAWAAFQGNDAAAAETLAKQAIEANVANKTDAMFLFADAVFKKGEFERAKKLYITLRGKTTGEYKATATKKIAACNKALKLPEADGVTN